MEAAVTVCTCFRANALVSARIKPSCSSDNSNFVAARHNKTTKNRIIFFVLVFCIFGDDFRKSTSSTGRNDEYDSTRSAERRWRTERRIGIFYIVGCPWAARFCYYFHFSLNKMKPTVNIWLDDIEKKRFIFELNIKGNYNVFDFRRRTYYVLIRLTNRMLHAEYEYFSRYVFSFFSQFKHLTNTCLNGQWNNDECFYI